MGEEEGVAEDCNPEVKADKDERVARNEEEGIVGGVGEETLGGLDSKGIWCFAIVLVPREVGEDVV